MANEKRLIDANALLELVQFRLPIDSHNAEVIAGCVDITRRLVQNAPTVDAVEVCRCKDCIFGELDDDCYLCRHHGCDWNNGNHFCSYGERRTDNG